MEITLGGSGSGSWVDPRVDARKRQEGEVSAEEIKALMIGVYRPYEFGVPSQLGGSIAW